jgi:hypothetical protein
MSLDYPAAGVGNRSSSRDRRRSRLTRGPLLGFCQECLHVERLREHPERAVLVSRPLLPRPVPVELEAVAVRIAEVEGFGDAVVGGAVEPDPSFDEPAERVGEALAIRVPDRGVVEAGVTGRRRSAAPDSQVLSPMW